MRSTDTPSSVIDGLSARARAATGVGARLRAAAGRAAGTRRRGSFLVIVIATLALLAVIGVAYVTVGRSDRATVAAVSRQVTVQGVEEGFADYVAGVVARDALATRYSAGEAGLDVEQLPLSRAAADHPSTDARTRSDISVAELSGSSWLVPFSPVGGFDARFYPTNGGPASWPATDPWLASSEPSNVRAVASGGGALVRGDWSQISNFAPDGRFVNLFNLRGATSGAPAQGVGFGATPAEMQAGLWSWLDSDLSTPEIEPAPYDIPAARRNEPALLTTNQYSLFRLPGDRADVGPRPPGPSGAPAFDAREPSYSFADADGDGYLDSRWFEVIDARDLNNIVRFLPTDAGVRYFFAARAVDLSGRVNVNTAGDFVAAPTDLDRAGVTPAEIDLRRLLTLADFPGAYSTLVQPQDLGLSSTTRDNYEDYASATARDVGVAGYRTLNLVRSAGPVPPATGPQGDISGGAAALTSPARAALYAQFGGTRAGSTVIGGTTPELLVGGNFGSDDLLELLTRRVANDPGRDSRLEGVLGGRFRQNNGSGGSDDEQGFSPLRENRGEALELPLTNFPNGTTTTDVAEGRAAQMIADVRQRLTTASGARPLAPRPLRVFSDAELGGASSVAAKERALVEEFFGTPGRLGLIEMPVNVRTPGPRGTLDATAVPVNPRQVGGVRLIDFPGVVEAAVQRTFHALAFSLTDGLWSEDEGALQWRANQVIGSPASDPQRARHYGRVGPEFALNAAAHLAVNFVDSAGELRDEDDQPPTTTNPAPITTAVLGTVTTTNGSAGDPTPAARVWLDAGAIDLNLERVEKAMLERRLREAAVLGPTEDSGFVGKPLLAERPEEVRQPETVIFANRPQPFISEVSIINLFVDAPPDSRGGAAVGADSEQVDEPITINGTIPVSVRDDGDNADLVFHAIAVQLTNGFRVPLQEIQDDYYLELVYSDPNDNAAPLAVRYALGAAGDPGLDLAPVGEDGSAVTLYIAGLGDINDARAPDGEDPIVARWDNVMNRWSSARQVRFPTWVSERLGGSGLLAVRQAPPLTTRRAGVQESLQVITDRDAGSLVQTRPPEQAAAWPLTDVRLRRRTDLSQSVLAGGDSSRDFVADRVRRVVRTGQAVDSLREIAESRAAQGLGNLALGNNEIQGTEAGADNGPETGSDLRDNTGYAFLAWSNLIRPVAWDDSALDAGRPPAFVVGALDFARKSDVDADSSYFVDDAAQSDTSFATLVQFGRNVLFDEFPIDRAPHQKPRAPYTIGTAFNAPFEIHTPAPLDTLNVGSTSIPAAPPRADQLRASDVLERLAVGPRYELTARNPQNGNESAAFEPLQWVTLGEALAQSLGAELAPDTAIESTSPMIGATSLDSGSLALTDYAPFVDANTNNAFDDDEVRTGLGIPAAQVALSAFTALPLTETGLNAAVPGLVNVNTAPLAVLRTLPMLSPPAQDWWWTGGGHTQTSDVATTLLAYRDLSREQPRGASGSQFLDFRLENNGSSGVDRGRQYATGIQGVRQDLGLSALGEAMSAFDINFGSNLHSIDRLGTNGADNSRAGLDSTPALQRLGTAEPAPWTYADNDIEDEQGELLAIYKALGSTASVRSDYFAVWFVVHGYRREDCENLAPEDPLTPSLAKRFLIVLDRSSVVRAGDSPRVLLFKELPMP